MVHKLNCLFSCLPTGSSENVNFHAHTRRVQSIEFRDYLPKQGPIDTQDCCPQPGPKDATINLRYLIRYWVDVLAYAHSNRFGPLHILSYFYYYWLICRMCSSLWITNPQVRLVRQRHTPLTFLTRNRAAGRDSPGYDSTQAFSDLPGYELSGVRLHLSP